MSKTYKRECKQSITLVRDGKRIELTTGQKFEFTQAEYDGIMESSPNALSAEATVDLDSGDVDLKKVEDKQAGNQTNPPADTPTGDDAAGKKAAPKKKTAATDDEL